MASVRGNWVRPVDQGVRISTIRFPMPGELVWLHRNNEDTANGLSSTTMSITTVSPSTGALGRPKAEGEDRKYQPHVCVVLSTSFQVAEQDKIFWSIQLFNTHAFTASNDSESFVKSRASPVYLPLPPPVGQPASTTPSTFGEPLEVAYVPERRCWLAADPRSLEMGYSGRYRPFEPPIILSHMEFDRLKLYAARMNSINGAIVYRPPIGPFVAADAYDPDFEPGSDSDELPWEDPDEVYCLYFPDQADKVRAHKANARIKAIDSWRHDVAANTVSWDV